MDNPLALTAPILSKLQNNLIIHGFFTRKGGVSTDIYNSLNVGFGSADLTENIITNRTRVTESLNISLHQLITLHQIHSANVLVLDQNYNMQTKSPLQADALVTNQTGIALGILTADCAPVLFIDAKARIIAAAHAGWRGALGGILPKTIAAMEQLGAQKENIIAVLGPSISAYNYEVGLNFYQIFLAANHKNICYFYPTDKLTYFYFDLRKFICDQLQQIGIVTDMINLCTYAMEDSFFSYRRATHQNQPDYGRQISTILLI